MLKPQPQELPRTFLPSHDEKEPRSGSLALRGSQKKGGDLLSRGLGSTIGASGLNFSVRNGKRWDTGAIATINNLTVTTRNVEKATER